MTLAGTRPPTLDEWNKYELHHRARLAIKPGITGMWQVSGRSEITDFEEVVSYAGTTIVSADIKNIVETTGKKVVIIENYYNYIEVLEKFCGIYRYSSGCNRGTIDRK